MAVSAGVAGEAMASLAKLPRRLLDAMRKESNHTDENSLERGLPIEMDDEGLRRRRSLGQLATPGLDDGGSSPTTSGTLTPGSEETSSPAQDNEDTKDSFVRTALRRLSTNFGSATFAEQNTTDQKEFNKSRGYDRFKKDRYETVPLGFPRLARYISSDSDFAVCRGFKTGHIRHILQYQVEITELEKRLDQLDSEDGANPDMRYRLRHTKHKPHWDTTQIELLEEHRVKLMEYDELVLKHSQMQALGRATKRNHRSVFNWIWTHKPLDKGFDDFIFHARDMLAMEGNRSNYFQNSIQENIHTWPWSLLKGYLITQEERDMTSDTNVVYYSETQLSTLAGYLLITTAVGSLLVPVHLLFLIPMSRVLMSITTSIFIVAFTMLLYKATGGNVYRVFVGTATYGAILVMFLGNISAGNGSVGT